MSCGNDTLSLVLQFTQCRSLVRADVRGSCSDVPHMQMHMHSTLDPE